MTKALEIAQVPNFLEANTTGLVVNAISYNIGSSFIANSTALISTGYANVTISVNSASFSVGSNFIANTTGAYHTGVVNAASYTVGSNFVANTTGAYHTGTVNAASYTVGSSFVANSTAVGVGTTSTLGNSLLNVLTGITARTEAASGVTPYIQSYNGNASTDLKTWRFGTVAAGDLIFETVNDAYSASTERMRIDSSANLKFNSGYGSVATAYGCRAWVNFNGTGVVTIRASGNVSSITDNGTGDYTVNFTTAMSDANYGVTGSAGRSDSPGGRIFEVKNATAPTTSSVRVLTTNIASTPTDYDFVSASIFR